MRYAWFTITVMALAILFLPNNAEAAWYDTNYGYCRKMSITAGGNVGGAATTTSTAFPLVATSTIADLKSTEYGGKVQVVTNDEPIDVIFTNGTDCIEAGGSDILDFYFESYASTTGAFVAWVQPATISSTTATSILMYYGNAAASNQQDKAGVWDSQRESAVYNLDETDLDGGAGDIKDATANAINGTTVSMASANQVSGQANGALNFELGDLVSMGDNLDQTGNPFSVSLWFKDTTGGDAVQHLVGKGPNEANFTSAGFKIVLASDLFRVDAYDTASKVQFFGTNIVDDAWYHAVVTFPISTEIAVFMNGVKTACSSSCTANEFLSLGDLQNAFNFTLGARPDAGGNRSTAVIDDVRVYNGALHAMDILTIYNNTVDSETFWTINDEVRQPVDGLIINLPVNFLSLLTGLEGWWTFDGEHVTWSSATAGTATDVSANGNTGTMTGMNRSLASISGKNGQAFAFDGTNDYVSVGNAGSGIMSIAFWVKPDTSSNQKLINIDGTDQIETNGSSQVTATSFPGATIYVNGIAGSTIGTDGWYHVVVTDSTGVNASSFEIGRVSSTYFDGALDDVRIYNRALSSNEVRLLHTITKGGNLNSSIIGSGDLGTNLVAWWTFDGNSTTWSSETTALSNDRSGNGITATLNSMSRSLTPVAGKIGQGLDFDGVNDNATSSSELLDDLGPMTFSAWIKPETMGGNSLGHIFAKGMVGSVPIINFNVDSNSTKRYDFAVDFDGTTNLQYFTGQDSVILGQWQQVAVTWDGGTNGSGVHVYRNGLELSAGNPATNGDGDRVSDAGTAFYIGNRQSGNRQFDGIIDDVRVYDRVLSAAEIRQLYEMGR